jgi:S-adenosylmethionine:tRNA ribosyltransferase-isomerase
MSTSIPIQDYYYKLPDDRIAHFPLTNRDESKLLVYYKGEIRHEQFKSMVDLIPQNAFLFFNNTRVIPARIHFLKETGAHIEVFLLNPVAPSVVLAETMQTTETCLWHCTVGNLKRWKENTVLTKSNNEVTLTAQLTNHHEGLVEFRWTPSALSFAEVIDQIGVTPLPPYIKREAETADRERYQTIYSQQDGAVAAPTAGLHFSDQVFARLQARGIRHDFLTLHVSAGTFQPVKTENALEHTMHEEQIVITKKNIENLLLADSLILPVGTTSMRTLESLYWYGVKLLENPDAPFIIHQGDPYRDYKSLPSQNEALTAVYKVFQNTGTDVLTGHTSIYIYPGYSFRICQGLITNFHLPGSTLMLLVAAFVGMDWRRIYEAALHNQYRFLSYGDSSLLIP